MIKDLKIITKFKLDNYLYIAEKAFKKSQEAKKNSKLAEAFLDTAERYISDAKHFKDKGDYVTAFAALNYAHGWLDAGVKSKLFRVKDPELFAGVD